MLFHVKQNRGFTSKQTQLFHVKQFELLPAQTQIAIQNGYRGRSYSGNAPGLTQRRRPDPLKLILHFTR